MVRLLLGLGCAALSLSAAAAEMEKSELHIKTELTGKTEIHLNQQAQKIMGRDRIRVDLRIEVRGSNGKQIQDEVNKRMATAMTSVHRFPSVVAETGSYSVFREPESKSPDTWHASQGLILTSEDFEGVLTLVGELQNNGLLMSNMRFFLAPDTMKAAQSDLTAQALTELRGRADEIAADLGMTIDHYKSITIGNAFEMNDGANRVGAVAASSANGKPTAQAGESTVMLGVQADVILTPGKAH